MSIIKMKKMTVQCPEVIERIKDIKGVYTQKGVENTVFFVAKLQKQLTDLLDKENCQYTITDIEEVDHPTVMLNNCQFIRPFGSLLTNHALPLYGDLDPTGFYAICFCILFGVMFGDIGQGFILILIGLIFRKKDNFAVFSRVGIFSMIFGWLYGSIFGNEEIIGEWMQEHRLAYWRFGLLERKNTEILLLVVAAIGIAMIMAAVVINIIDKAHHHKQKEILTANNCLPALMFYMMLLLLSGQVLGKAKGKFTLVLAFLLALANAALLLKQGKWKYLTGSIIKYFSAIMAFLQVGCFALAHAFLMYIVYYIAGLIPDISVIIIIAGNAIVMAIEATEVWHQCSHLILSTLHGFITDKEEH
ncbi:MAG: V-type ATPase 116kDa subunit family protein [Erysipelotrichia bacterium]|nr:V-type ATPase 116kDa subunit family protein [Erysipelotrichia bacterium]